MANSKTTTSGISFEEKLWAAADKMRGHMDPSEYKHVVLGLVFLKYISDSFLELHDGLSTVPGADPEDRDEYRAEGVFWVPEGARWPYLQANAKQPTIGKLIDDAMTTIETENTKLRGVLPKDFARPSLDKTRLGELVDLIGTIGLGDNDSKSQDILGRVYEYFLGRFASSEGKGGGEFYTPSSVVQLMVEMIEPYKGRVYDPCCGSGGFFVQSEKFVNAHSGNVGAISVYGQESNHTTWKLAQMNLAIRGIEGNLGETNADSFHADQHKDLKADFILANPPFNISDWGGERLREDVRWKFGTPPAGNANFAWVQHFIHHLAPKGVAGFVLSNGSMSSSQSGEGDIRKAVIEADLVDCMIALPPQLFYTTQIPACLWFLARNKSGSGFRDRRGETLFIDARNMGALVNRTLRELTPGDIAEIADTYHAWRGEKGAGDYENVAGFCKSAPLDEMREHGCVLTPGRYVGAADADEDDERFEDKMQRLTATLFEQFDHSEQLASEIRERLSSIAGSI